MNRALVAGTVLSLVFVVINPISAEGYRNFVSLTAGVNDVWNTFVLMSDGDYDVGYGVSLGYGRRLGRDSHWVFHTGFWYDHTTSEGGTYNTEPSSWEYFNVAANLRYYVGALSEWPAGYVGLGPALSISHQRGCWVRLNANATIGGDFPLGHGWSIIPEVTADLSFVKVQIGVGYWFM